MSEPKLDRELTFDEQCLLARQIKRLKEENARLRSNQSLLDVLREIARDPAVPPHLRLRAAEAGVSHETPRLTQTQNLSLVTWDSQDGLAARLERARARMKLAEADPSACMNRVIEPERAA
jgi:hypothetical protein